MSLPSYELITAASTEYIGEEPAYRFLEPELRRQRELRESQTWAMDGSEDYAPSMSKYKSPVKPREMLETIEALKNVAPSVSNMLRELVSLKGIMMNSLRKLGAPILDVEIHYGEGVGPYALATLDCNSRQALEYWLKIVDEVCEHDIPIFITWTGSIDVTPEEMGTYIADVLAKMNIFLATEKPINIVRIIEEEWGL